MASAGLLALLDDIAMLLDDVALLTKVAARKTSGVLADDLALNAQQVSGVRAERELPVVWAVAKGSAKNKLIIVPIALLLSAFAPWFITPLLMLGGCFLCYEGFEKVYHHVTHLPADKTREHNEKLQALSDPNIDLVAFEQKKIQGAVRTDFILSAEIVVIALGTVKDVAFSQQVLVVSIIAALITVGVYGVVAAIVKLDDLGFYLIKSELEGFWADTKRALGRGVLWFCPHLMKTLSVVGTIAMFLVGGGILIHGLHFLHDVENYMLELDIIIAGGKWLLAVMPAVYTALVGISAGALLVSLGYVFSTLVKKLRVSD
jgi:predicted DNA repair protein MutK